MPHHAWKNSTIQSQKPFPIRVPRTPYLEIRGLMSHKNLIYHEYLSGLIQILIAFLFSSEFHNKSMLTEFCINVKNKYLSEFYFEGL